VLEVRGKIAFQRTVEVFEKLTFGGWGHISATAA